MTREEKIKVLTADKCTEKEAEKFLSGDTTIYKNPDDYFQNLKNCNCFDGETIEDARAGKIEDVSIVIVDGHEYLIEYVR